MKKVLVVDDELGIRNLLSEILEEEGYAVLTAEDAAQAREIVRTDKVDLILLDIWMPDTDGVTLLKEFGANHLLRCPVIMMSGHGTIETAIEATRFGAVDFLEKPIALKKLLEACEKAISEWDYEACARNTPIGKGRLQIEQELRERRERERLEQERNAPARQGERCVFKLDADRPEGPYVVDIDGFDITTEDPLPVLDIAPLSLKIDFNQPFRDFRDAMERAYLLNVLRKKNGSVIELSRHAHLERTHLYRKLKSLDIDPNECSHLAIREAGQN